MYNLSRMNEESMQKKKHILTPNFVLKHNPLTRPWGIFCKKGVPFRWGRDLHVMPRVLVFPVHNTLFGFTWNVCHSCGSGTFSPTALQPGFSQPPRRAHGKSRTPGGSSCRLCYRPCCSRYSPSHRPVCSVHAQVKGLHGLICDIWRENTARQLARRSGQVPLDVLCIGDRMHNCWRMGIPQ